MGPIDFVVLGVILLIVALAAWYIIRAKKNGAKCIGCPSDCCCSKPKKGKSKGKDEESCSCGCCGCGRADASKVSAEDHSEA